MKETHGNGGATRACLGLPCRRRVARCTRDIDENEALIQIWIVSVVAIEVSKVDVDL